MRQQTWSIIILCYNESESIGKVILETKKNIKKLSQKNWEIIVVDDGSTDGSTRIIKDIAVSDKNIKTFFHKKNRGIGPALLSGYKRARYENISVVPGDGQFNTKELLNYASVKDKEFISFYRKENTSYSTFRNILSLINRKINEYFLGIKLVDVNWVKIYKRKQLKRLNLRLKSSLIESEICSKLIFLGYKPVQVISTYFPRIGGKSKGASLKIVFQALRETILLIKEINRYRIAFSTTKNAD